VHTGFCWGNIRQRGNLEDLGVEGRIILKYIFKKYDMGCLDWIYVAQDSNRRPTRQNAVMNLLVP
jgi:hypothetical protein